MDPRLRDLLGEAAAQKDAGSRNATHVSFYGPQGRWEVENWAAFWLRLCALGRADDADLCLGEVIGRTLPVTAEVTLRYKLAAGPARAAAAPEEAEEFEPYDERFFGKLILAYQQAIRESFAVTDDDLTCVLLESPPRQEGDFPNIFVTFVLRVQFPFCRVSAANQAKFVKPRVVELLHLTNPLGEFCQPLGDWDQNIRHYTSLDAVPLYGHRKAPGDPVPALSGVWKAGEGAPAVGPPEGSADVDLPLEGLSRQSLAQLFDPGFHSHALSGLLSRDELQRPEFAAQPPEFWLPLFLSIEYWSTVAQLRPTADASKAPQVTSNGSTPRAAGAEPGEDEDTTSDLYICDRMLQLLDPNRYAYEISWLEIGRACNSADRGGDEGLRLWVKYTERAVKNFPEVPAHYRILGEVAIGEVSAEVYSTLYGSPITVKTLAWYAMSDSKARYTEWHNNWCWEAMKKALDRTHASVAHALYRCYWLEYVVTGTSLNMWWRFADDRWNISDQGIDLKKKISTAFEKNFIRMRTLVSREAEAATGDAKLEKESVIKKISALVLSLGDERFKNSLMSSVKEHFHFKRFSEFLDSNPCITGLLKGVIEVSDEKIFFRRGKPEDYVSYSTMVAFRPEFTMEHRLVRECWLWMRQIFPDEELLHHFMKFAGSCLYGKNANKIFPIWTGEGDNSKSMLVKLFEVTLGQYSMKFPVSLLTGRRTQSSSATPELARAKSKRIAFIQEPDDDETMNKALIKGFTGGDSFYARALHDNGADIQADFKLVLMCNEVPGIIGADRAVKNRTRLFPFLSKWVPNPPATEEEQFAQRLFKMNPQFDRRIPHLAPAFLWLMVQYYPIYATEGIDKDPEIVKSHTAEYWKKHDTYAQFIAENVRLVVRPHPETGAPTPDPNFRMTLRELYELFKTWYREALPKDVHNIPNRTKVRTELCNRWGPMIEGGWIGIVALENTEQSFAAAAPAGPPAPARDVAPAPAPTPAREAAPARELAAREAAPLVDPRKAEPAPGSIVPLNL